MKELLIAECTRIAKKYGMRYFNLEEMKDEEQNFNEAFEGNEIWVQCKKLKYVVNFFHEVRGYKENWPDSMPYTAIVAENGVGQLALFFGANDWGTPPGDTFIILESCVIGKQKTYYKRTSKVQWKEIK